MIVGVPREIKDHEYRVALTPAGVQALVAHGHQVLVETGAGAGSGFSDAEYRAAGAELVADHAQVFQRAELVVKVKEPLPSEYDLLQPDQILFTFLHLVAVPDLARVLLQRRVTAIAYETVEREDGSLPLLTPMSEIAGRMAIQVAARYLEKPQGGAGLLLGGVPGVPPAHVVILGAGTVGTEAARVALGMGALVTVLNRTPERLRLLQNTLGGRLITEIAQPATIAAAVARADVLIGAVLVPGAPAPRLVTRDMVRTMRPGSVIVDVAIDQGGSVETSRPTSHSQPVYVEEGVIHYCVPNMPGAVPRTATLALTAVTLPYVLALADLGFGEAVRRDRALARGVTTYRGAITHPAVAAGLGHPFQRLEDLLAQAPAPVPRC
jgi:alanine dehydrogenase